MSERKKYIYTKLDDLCNSFSISCINFNLFNLTPALDWFSIASKINSVDYDTWKYNDLMGLCESADDYDKEKGKSDKEIVENLVRFTFIWSGIESLILILKIKNHPRFAGKINAATTLIKEKLEGERFCRCAYLNLVDKLKILLKESEIHLPEFKNVDAFSPLGEGIQIVYQIRNNFAHGTFNFPEPDGWNIRNVVEQQILKIASYITIITAQFLIISVYKDEDLIAFAYDDKSDNEIELKLFKHFHQLHFNYVVPEKASKVA